MATLSVLIAKQLNKIESNEATNTREHQTAAVNMAKDIFFEDIHPYFSQQWGDYWLSKFQSPTLICEFSKIWIHSIIGLSRDDIARGVASHASTANAQYPPTALRLRQLAVSTRDDFDALNLEILNENSTRD